MIRFRLISAPNSLQIRQVLLIFFTHKKKNVSQQAAPAGQRNAVVDQEETIDLPFSYQVNLSWGKPLWVL
jgi:hypothetical protein